MDNRYQEHFTVNFTLIGGKVKKNKHALIIKVSKNFLHWCKEFFILWKLVKSAISSLYSKQISSKILKIINKNKNYSCNVELQVKVSIQFIKKCRKYLIFIKNFITKTLLLIYGVKWMAKIDAVLL